MNTKKSRLQHMVLTLFSVLILFGVWSGQTVAGSPKKIHSQKAVSDKTQNVVKGFRGNSITFGVNGGTISGGGQTFFPNQVTADMGSIGGGMGNESGRLAFVGGGMANLAQGLRAFIGGGSYNTASLHCSMIGGGNGNRASGEYSTISGGNVNTALELFATVGGGSGNIAAERHATVGGGSVNQARGYAATIGGGIDNIASEAYAAIGGGVANVAQGQGAAIQGGGGNYAFGDDTTVAGGLNNRISDNYSTIGGGRANSAGNSNENRRDAAYATVGGGNNNSASGAFAVIPGGDSNVAAGAYSFAAGRRASINPAHAGSFLFADSNDFDFNSMGENEFAVRAIGGVRLITAVDGSGNPNVTVRLAPGSGSWESYSDRNIKTNFNPIDEQEILKRVLQLPLTTWNYKSQPSSIKHIGPMAQDFHALFRVGSDDKHISSVDIDGVAMAAIQGLYQVVQEKEALLKTQQQRLDALEAEISRQKDQLALLQARFENRRCPIKAQMGFLPAVWRRAGFLTQIMH